MAKNNTRIDELVKVLNKQMAKHTQYQKEIERFKLDILRSISTIPMFQPRHIEVYWEEEDNSWSIEIDYFVYHDYDCFYAQYPGDIFDGGYDFSMILDEIRDQVVTEVKNFEEGKKQDEYASNGFLNTPGLRDSFLSPDGWGQTITTAQNYPTTNTIAVGGGYRVNGDGMVERVERYPDHANQEAVDPVPVPLTAPSLASRALRHFRRGAVATPAARAANTQAQDFNNSLSAQAITQMYEQQYGVHLARATASRVPSAGATMRFTPEH